MKIGLKWLNELVPVDVPVERLVELLDMSGTKVESVERPSRDIAGVVVAKVLNIEPHPNADNLTLVEVEVANQTTDRVVCGARNFAVGDKVPLATVGARLPDMEITERKIRGFTSRGMLCSAAELGVSQDHAGILVLPRDARLGENVVGVLGLDDTIIELELTPNRPDCMSMIGVAREVGALLRNPLTVPDAHITYSNAKSPVDVHIDDREGCPRYLAMYLDEVAVAPSPSWLVARLSAAGVRSISNIVDVTNYVLLECGQPLHAFDASKVHDQKIVVRRARSGEVLTTLDGVERKMSPDDLLIADPRRALAIAGVMGGGDSEVSDETTSVLLESAYFDPVSVAFTSRRHLLRSEASARFERGADPEIVPYAAARAAGLMSELSGARVSETVIDRYPKKIERQRVTLRPQRTDRVLGYSVPAAEQAGYLKALGLIVQDRNSVLDVQVPTFRPDIEREVDLIEEVARLAGFDRLPSTVPPGQAGVLDGWQQGDRTIRRVLATMGLFEAWTSSFFSERDLDRLGLPSEHVVRRLVRIANPMSQDEDAMRTTLLPGLLRSLSRNFAQQRAKGVGLFEIARVYEPAHAEPSDRTPKQDLLPQEGSLLSSVMGGERVPQTWAETARPWSFDVAKSVLVDALDALRITDLSFTERSAMPFHPTRAANVNLAGRVIGVLGELHPAVCDNFDVPERTLAFEIALGPVFAALPEKPTVDELPRFPAVFMDLAVVTDESVPAGEVLNVIRTAGEPETVSARLFDVYRGPQVAEGKKSVAFALELRDPKRTLTDEDQTAVRDRVTSALRDRLGAELRT